MPPATTCRGSPHPPIPHPCNPGMLPSPSPKCPLPTPPHNCILLFYHPFPLFRPFYPFPPLCVCSPFPIPMQPAAFLPLQPPSYLAFLPSVTTILFLLPAVAPFPPPSLFSHSIPPDPPTYPCPAPSHLPPPTPPSLTPTPDMWTLYLPSLPIFSEPCCPLPLQLVAGRLLSLPYFGILWHGMAWHMLALLGRHFGTFGAGQDRFWEVGQVGWDGHCFGLPLQTL